MATLKITILHVVELTSILDDDTWVWPCENPANSIDSESPCQTYYFILKQATLKCKFVLESPAYMEKIEL